MNRHVRGVLFVDYVRIIRSHKSILWREHLRPEDLPYLEQRIDMLTWYPMATYERLGLAILELVAHGDLALIQRWGRETVDVLHRSQPDLFVRGDPRVTFMRFDVLRQTLFDFRAAWTNVVRDGKVLLEIQYGMSAAAEEAACYQSLGFLERMAELSGATGVRAAVLSRGWEEAETTTIEVTWEPVIRNG